MTGNHFIYVLWAGLAIALVWAATTDIQRRHISNKLNIAIAIGAVPFWFASGLDPWPDIAIRVAVAAAVFGAFTILFAIRMMGGGDVKLLGALALWLPGIAVMDMLIVMAIGGGVLTLILIAHGRLRAPDVAIKVPYGVAIAFAGLWVVGHDAHERYINHFG